MSRRFLIGLVVSCAAFTASHSTAQLMPPPGPVQSTDRVRINQQGIFGFPYFITQPGSYVLTSNITGIGGASVITIAAPDVTLDLNGFMVRGGRIGIEVMPGMRNATILNGTVANNAEQGVDARSADQTRLEGLRLNSNGLRGAYLGDGASVLRCTAESNLSTGFRIGSGAVVRDSSARYNNGLGLWCAERATISGFTATGNMQHGIAAGVTSTLENCAAHNNGFGNVTSGIHADQGSTIRGCAADGNARKGITLIARGNVLDCSTKDNREGGISVGYGTTVQRCTAHDNGVLDRSGAPRNGEQATRTRQTRIEVGEAVTDDEAPASARGGSPRGAFFNDGISTGDGCTVVACDAQGNADAGIAVAHSSTVIGCTVRYNYGGGIETLGWTTIRDCTAINGYWIGIDAGESSTVENCTVTDNQGSGITVTSNSTVRRCTVNANHQMGIQVAGSRNRIEENQAANNLGQGFSVTGFQNIVMRNSASGNSFNYNIFPGNNFGNVQFLFGGPIFTNEPWANFEY